MKRATNVFSLWKSVRETVLFDSAIFGSFSLTRRYRVFSSRWRIYFPNFCDRRRVCDKDQLPRRRYMHETMVGTCHARKSRSIYFHRALSLAPPLSISLSFSPSHSSPLPFSPLLSSFPLPLSIFFFKFQAPVSLNRSFPHSLTANNRPVTAIPPRRN